MISQPPPLSAQKMFAPPLNVWNIFTTPPIVWSCHNIDTHHAHIWCRISQKVSLPALWTVKHFPPLRSPKYFMLPHISTRPNAIFIYNSLSGIYYKCHQLYQKKNRKNWKHKRDFLTSCIEKMVQTWLRYISSFSAYNCNLYSETNLYLNFLKWDIIIIIGCPDYGQSL